MSKQFGVLVVDDKVSNRITLTALLSRLKDCQLFEAESGEQALLMVMDQPVHLILLDVQMPGMDGFETAQHLQMLERTRDIPIVFISAAKRTEEFISRGYAVGAVDYLTKPLDDNLILNRVRLYQRLHEKESDLWAAVNKLQSAQERLVQTEKLTALSPVVAAISHELNTPIGNCMLAATTLNDMTAQLESHLNSQTPMRISELKDYLESNRDGLDLMMRGLDRASKLINNFKDVALSTTHVSCTVFDLKQALEVTLKRVQLDLDKTPYRLELSVEEGIEMDSYPGSIGEIIGQLVRNSVVHGFDGLNRGLIQLSATREGEQVRIVYRDDGHGMSDVVRKHVFDPFFTTRLGQGGSGLGMYICHNQVRGLLGGQIEVQSRPGDGCVVVMTLPCQAPRLPGGVHGVA
ncbi:MAG: hybrid sensor histidine kinase/response regulator [Burkholderiaceae bacterium]|nr:hybrid sensor histidine kinase/response regulator [Roseateles sp.]MBV8471435.1 hybrid sensor histidine kinase/response regulator [Burkholderiaceae bacterium]